MSKKKKKRDKRTLNIVERALDEFLASHTPSDAHVFPMQQPWHLPKPWCWCHPEAISEHPLTGHKLWVHNLQIH